jgi:hypothetical protein
MYKYLVLRSHSEPISSEKYIRSIDIYFYSAMANSTSIKVWMAAFILSISSTSVTSSSIRWTDCTKNVPESSRHFSTSAIDLSSLPSTLHCGQLDVPMDYSRPFCKTNMITLGIAMYRPSKPKGALFQYDLPSFQVSCVSSAENGRSSNSGGTDAGVMLAWEIALNYTNAFNELLEFDILGTLPFIIRSPCAVNTQFE